MASTTPRKKSPTRATERLSLRATAPDKSLLLAAAKRRRMTMTVYILHTAIAQAEAELLDETAFKLSPEKWNAFAEALDRPVQRKPQLHKLLTQPSVFEPR